MTIPFVIYLICKDLQKFFLLCSEAINFNEFQNYNFNLCCSVVNGNVTFVGKVGECYPLQQHEIPSIIRLKDGNPFHPKYVFHGFSVENCKENSVVTTPLKPDVPIFVNDRNPIYSFNLEKPVPPTFQLNLIFTYQSGVLYFTIDNTNCYNIYESYQYPSRVGIYGEDGNDVDNFLRIYSDLDCMIDTIISHRNGSEEIKSGDDLFEISLKDPIAVVKYFMVTTTS